MTAMSVSTVFQIVVGLALLNVWLVRAKSATAYRGGSARSLSEEFAVYSLPDWVFYSIGVLKIGSGMLLIIGLWVPEVVPIAAGVVVGLMVGALLMHAKVKDPLMKSLPAFLMLLMSVAIVLLR
jgi:DoxX-like family